MKAINKLPGEKIYLTYLDSKQFSRPMEMFSHIKLIPQKRNSFMLYRIMFYGIEAELPSSYGKVLLILYSYCEI